MNLSGKAVRFWVQQEKISPGNWCVIADDLALPFGQLRLRPSGSDGGHNGLKNIQETMQTQQYLRLRWGIGSEFAKGRQSDFVLGKWSAEEEAALPAYISRAADCIETLIANGQQQAMSLFNTKPA
jgi:PTH1 family peptidyl-tRNA hydrolase